MESGSSRVVRFGVFELDFAARELRKRGVRLRLQDQPFRVLEALLEKPSEVVTRDTLKERLWADDEFVEFDKSLNTAIQKIRQALGDSAASPRFLETVPKVGYRFIAPLETVRDEASLSGEVSAQGGGKRIVLALSIVFGILAVAGAVSLVVDRVNPSSTQYTSRQLTFESGTARDPSISPDGKLFAYTSDRSGEGNFDIWIQQIGEGDPIPLTNHPAHDWTPSFSPDGKLVVFYSDRDGGGIYVTPALGGNARRIVSGVAKAPRFSPDGSYIAYTSRTRTGQSIWVVPSAGGEPKELRPDNSAARNLIFTAPIWLPDSRILTGSNRDENWWILDPDGRAHVRTDISEDWLVNQGFARR